MHRFSRPLTRISSWPSTFPVWDIWPPGSNKTIALVDGRLQRRFWPRTLPMGLVPAWQATLHIKRSRVHRTWQPQLNQLNLVEKLRICWTKCIEFETPSEEVQLPQLDQLFVWGIIDNLQILVWIIVKWLQSSVHAQNACTVLSKFKRNTHTVFSRGSAILHEAEWLSDVVLPDGLSSATPQNVILLQSGERSHKKTQFACLVSLMSTVPTHFALNRYCNETWKFVIHESLAQNYENSMVPL